MNRDQWRKLGIGATGEFPRGHLNEHDEGELRMAISADRRTQTVRIEFGKKVAWLGLGPADARNLAALLLKRAIELEGDQQ